MRQVSSLASVYHRPSTSFLLDSGRQAVTQAVAPAGDDKAWHEGDGGSHAASAGGGGGGSGSGGASEALDVLDLIGADAASGGSGAGAQQRPASSAVVDDLLDLLGDIGGGGAAPPPPAAGSGAGASGGGMIDLMDGMSIGGSGGGGASGGVQNGGGAGAAGFGAQGGQPLKTLLASDKGGGMEIRGALNRRAGKVFYDLEFHNASAAPLSGIAIQLNKNLLGLTNGAALQVPAIAPGASASAALPMMLSADKVAAPPAGAPPLLLQVAIKNNQGVFYFKDVLPLRAVLTEQPAIASAQYPQRWQAIAPANQAVSPLSGFPLNLPHVENKVALRHRPHASMPASGCTGTRRQTAQNQSARAALCLVLLCWYVCVRVGGDVCGRGL